MKMAKRFNDDQIRRTDLPRDVFVILHDLCYHTRLRRISPYVKRAQEALRKAVRNDDAWPKHQTWLIKLLLRAYPDKVFVLGIIGEFVRLIKKRRKEKRGASNTTCICCGGWIPLKREIHRQHTCSDGCQNWYRRLTRAIDAARWCRYCGRPAKHAEAVKRRRLARGRVNRQITEKDAANRRGATRQGYRRITPSIKLGTSLALIPNRHEGVDREAVAEALEEG